MDEKILEKMRNIAEGIFGTAQDPSQIPIKKESLDKLQRLHPKSFIYKLENGEPVSWIVVVPTSEELMNRFLKGEINERELFDLTEPQKIYEAIYLCAAITIPEYRRKGYAKQLISEAINSIPHIKNVKLFSWPYSEEGRKLLENYPEILIKE